MSVSLSRPAAAARQLPALRRRALLVCAVGWCGLAAALSQSTLLGLPPRAVWQTVLLFALVNVLVWRWLPQHLPHDRFGAANWVTLGRAVGTAWLAALIGIDAGTVLALLWPALALVTLLLLADGLDGWLARRYRRCSGFGARFDMEVDALLMLVLSVLVWQLDKAGAWVLLAGLWRYLFVAAGLLWPWLAAPLAPSRRRQSFCVLQLGALLVCLAPPLAARLSAPLALLSVLGLSFSFGLDLHRLWRYRSVVS